MFDTLKGSLTFESMSDEQYFANPAISSSDIKFYINNGSEAFYQYKFAKSIPNNPSDSQKFGTLVHCQILEPEEFNNRYVILSESAKIPSSPNQRKFCEDVLSGMTNFNAYTKNYATKTMKEADIQDKAEALFNELSDYIKFSIESVGKTAITAEQYYNSRIIVDKFWDNEAVASLYEGNTALYKEVPLFEELEGVVCKAKLDLLIEKPDEYILVDLKTTTNANPTSFRESYHKYRYDLQLLFYNMMLMSMADRLNLPSKQINMYIVALQTTFPYNSVVYKVNVRDIKVDPSIMSSIKDSLNCIKARLSNNIPSVWTDNQIYEMYNLDELNLKYGAYEGHKE